MKTVHHTALNAADRTTSSLGLSRASKTASLVLATLLVTVIFYILLFGADPQQLGIAAFGVALVLAATCVGFTFWTLGGSR